MNNLMIKILPFILTAFSFLNAYDVEKDGKYWRVYNGNDLLGVYSYIDYLDKYDIWCGDPKKSVYDTEYVDDRGATYTKYYSSKREAQNNVIQHCKKR